MKSALVVKPLAYRSSGRRGEQKGMVISAGNSKFFDTICQYFTHKSMGVTDLLQDRENVEDQEKNTAIMDTWWQHI